MKHINKTYYWIGLLIFFALILGLRSFGLFTEINTEFFYVISGLWICLIILPLFSEIEFFGIKLKKEIENLKTDFKNEILSLKLEINNSNTQQVFLGYGIPPSDSKITELEEEINKLKEKNIIDKDRIRFDATKTEIVNEKFNVSDLTIQLFQIRYKLEELLTKVWTNYQEYFYSERKTTNPKRMIDDLKSLNLIDSEFFEIMNGILSICNSAIHGKMTSEKQREFVFENSNLIYDELNNILNEK